MSNEPEKADVKSEVTKLIQLREQRKIIVRRLAGDRIDPVDQFMRQQGILKTLQVGGLFGTQLLALDKPAIVRNEENIISGEVSSKQLDLQADGIYCKGMPPIDANLQRMEQRLLRQKQMDYFNRSNWQMRLDSDVTTHTITKPLDISLENNPAITCKLQSAVLSHRNNVAKSKYYRLDLNIGKLKIHEHPLFTEEDKLASDIEQAFYDYEKRVDLCLVDHLKERVEVLSSELQIREYELNQLLQVPTTTQQAQGKILHDKIQMLRKHLESAQNQLNDEKAAIQTGAESLYMKWQKLKDLRSAQRYSSTTTKLAVREYTEPGAETEYDFFLSSQEPAQEQNQPIPTAELSRRRSVQATRVFIRIYINGVYVARTKKAFLKWPQFEVYFGERFQIHLFTRPVNIFLEICTGFRWTRKIGIALVEAPGLNVNSLTSACEMYRNVTFMDSSSRGQYSGKIAIKTEWIGKGPSVPPIRFEDLATLRKKITKEVDSVEEGFVDINDPRNKAMVEFLKNKRAKMFEELLKKDALFPHHDIKSLRETILKERFRNSELLNFPVPLLEKDILKAPMFMRFIEDLKNTQGKVRRFKQIPLQSYRLKYGKDPQAKERLICLMEFITEKQNQVKLGVSKALLSHKNVVKEFIFVEQSFFKQCFQYLFAPRRKLKPVRAQVQTVSGDTTNSCKLNIIIYKGENIPVRDEAWATRYAQVERFYVPVPPAYKVRGMGEAPFPSDLNRSRDIGRPPSPNRSQYSPRDPYGRSVPRPPSPGFNPGVVDLPPPPPVSGQGYQTIERVQSFIEVRLLHNGLSRSVRTAPFDGTNPEWNEMLSLTFSSLEKTGFTKEELQDCESVLYFVLYDQILSVQQVLMDEGEIRVRLDRRYLGSFSLPLLTVFQNPAGVEANFKVKRPVCLFGYHTSKENPFVPFHTESAQHSPPFLDPDVDSYVMLKVSLDPPLELPQESEADYYPGFENPNFLFYASEWATRKKQEKRLKTRSIRLFAENTKGQSVFLPRFLSPLEPPQGLLTPNDRDSIAKLVRFVSLIPHIEDNQAFKDLPDVWTTSQEFLDLGFGDYEEHAILLCNYLKHFDTNSPHIQHYIMIGTGVPEGTTVYVLRRDSRSKDVEIWDASNGIGHSLFQENYLSTFLCIPVSYGTRSKVLREDQAISLKNVGCLVDSNDIYLNMQESADPYVIDYDVTNTKYWLPFLGTGRKRNEFFPTGSIPTIQTPLKYELTPSDFVQNLTIEIEDYVRKMFTDARSFEGERRPLITRWNSKISRQLYGILPEFESYCFNTRAGAMKSSMYSRDPKEHHLELTRIQDRVASVVGDVKNVYGFPLNIGFDSVDSVWEEVKNTDIHNIPDESIEFVLAVRVFEYPSFVCSVWVYIAALFNDPYVRHEFY
jgi:hypothetical protein